MERADIRQGLQIPSRAIGPRGAAAALRTGVDGSHVTCHVSLAPIRTECRTQIDRVPDASAGADRLATAPEAARGPEGSGSGTMCMPSIVDEVQRKRIAACGAAFRKATASPFGSKDEIGMLNLIDAASRDAIVSRADASKMFDLSVDNFIGMPGWLQAGDPSYQIWMTHTPHGEACDRGTEAESDLVSYSGDAIAMYTHTGTHIDALNHFGYHGEIFNHFKSAEHIGSRAWRVCGADKHPPVVARGILLDMAALHGVDMLPASEPIGPRDLADCLKHQGTELRPGDVVLIRTGRMRVWPDAARYMTDPPGLNRDGAKFLAEAGAIMIGSDTFTLEHLPSADPENWQVVHTYLLAEAGVPILEIADLEELGADKVHEFAFFGACIRFRGATGSPMRPIVMPLRA
jgi:kynurenine formamidase